MRRCRPPSSEFGTYNRIGPREVLIWRSPSSGGWGREGVRSEARAEQRLAPGGARSAPPNPDLVTDPDGVMMSISSLFSHPERSIGFLFGQSGTRIIRLPAGRRGRRADLVSSR